VTEIPEHLLKRSQAARSKASGTPAPAGDETPSTAVEPAAASAPAAADPAKPAKAAAAEPPKPKPDPPYVAAAKARTKIPFWAMATLSILPLWVFMYVRGLTPTEEVVAGPLGEGAEIYAGNCSGCHGGAGEGGLGYAFAGGEVLQTFPHIEDQLRFVYLGTTEYANAGVSIYGNPEREGGPHVTGASGAAMPAQGPTAGGGLTEAQILAVVCHERFTLGGADPAADALEEYETWCSPEAPAWEGLETGEFTFDNIAEELEGVIEVGTEPLAGSAPTP
jgi:mono/diheme cytochrome c family protein